MNILQQIFIDHYEQIMILLKPRAAVVENIDRMIHCGDPDYGCAIYECKSCGNVKFIPFHCRSRFCPTCGNFYAIQRSASVSLKLVRCRHRHLAFTISQEIRHFFLENRDLLNLLFHEDNKYVEETLPVLDFIKRLIIHIPEKHFKMIRYYGIYAKHHKQEPKLHKVVKPQLRKLFLSWYKWRALMLTCFQVDPIQRHVCGKIMTLMQIRFNKQKETLAEHYRKVMHKPPDWTSMFA